MDIKKQIRIALGLDKEEEAINLEFQAKLVDGTIIVSEADAMEVGIAISILAEDGTTMPLPVGNYETEDGVSFTVEEEGVVAEITEQLETEKAELENQVVELSSQPAEKPVEVSKFNEVKKNNVPSGDYNNMTRKEKFWYNLNKSKN